VRRVLVLGAGLVLAAGCASTGPLRPLAGGTTRHAWQQLEDAADSEGTFSTYASVRVATPEGRRSFRATLQLDKGDRVRMSAFSPVGTEVFGFEVSDGEMTFANHSRKTSWRGPFANLAEQLGIPASLDAVGFARLAFGLPAGTGDADLADVGNGVVRQGELTYRVSGIGIDSVVREGTGWRVTYEPGTYPPTKVTFEDEGGRSIVVRHLDLSYTRDGIEPIVVDSSYTCCVSPVIE